MERIADILEEAQSQREFEDAMKNNKRTLTMNADEYPSLGDLLNFSVDSDAHYVNLGFCNFIISMLKHDATNAYVACFDSDLHVKEELNKMLDDVVAQCEVESKKPSNESFWTHTDLWKACTLKDNDKSYDLQCVVTGIGQRKDENGRYVDDSYYAVIFDHDVKMNDVFRIDISHYKGLDEFDKAFMKHYEKALGNFYRKLPQIWGVPHW